LRFRCELDFDQVRFAVAFVTMRIVERAAQHPLLGARVPIGPGIAADIVRAAGAADHRVALVVGWHCDSLPMSGRRSKG